MASLDQELRSYARREHRGWGRVENLATFGAGIAGFGAAVVAGPLLLIPFGAFMVFGTVGVVGHWKSGAAEDKANDPPRDDYLERTLVDLPEIDLSVFGDDPLSSATAALVGISSRAVAYERAMVLADERAQGARVARVGWGESSRRDEADDWGTRAASTNQELAESANRLASVLEEGLRFELTNEQTEAVAKAMPEFSAGARRPIERLLNAGIDVRVLDFSAPAVRALAIKAGRDADPIQELAAALRDAGEASLAFADGYLDQRRQHPPALA